MRNSYKFLTKIIKTRHFFFLFVKTEGNRQLSGHWANEIDSGIKKIEKNVYL